MAYRARRKLADGFEVDLDLAHYQQPVFPQTDDEWIEVLRRPPETWTPAQVSAWAQRPVGHGGGQQGDWVARRLFENAIDGYLLLHCPGGSTALCRRLGVSDDARCQALEEAIRELSTLQDRIAYGDVLLPPPPDLAQQAQQAQQAGGAGAAAAGGGPGRGGAGRRSGQVDIAAAFGKQAHDRWLGVWGEGEQRGQRAPEAGGGRGGGRQGRGASLSVREQVYEAARAGAMAAAAAGPGRGAGAGAGSGQVAPGGTTRGTGGGGPRSSAAAAEGAAGAPGGGGAAGGARGGARRRAGDTAAVGDQGPLTPCGLQAISEQEDGEEGPGSAGEEEVDAAAFAGQLPATAGRAAGLFRQVQEMAALAAAHRDAAEKLKVLRMGGVGGLRRMEAQRQLAEELAAAEEAAAAAAAAAALEPPPPPKLEEVRQRGEEMRKQLRESSSSIDELTKVPLRRALRQAAEAAEDRYDEAEAARAASDAGSVAAWPDSARSGGSDAGGSVRGSDAERGSGGGARRERVGFDGKGNTRVRSGMWREVGEDGEDLSERSYRQSLSDTGRELMEDLDAKEASYTDPWVVFDSEEERGGPRGQGKDDAARRQRGRRRANDEPWVVPGLREGPLHGAGARLRPRGERRPGGREVPGQGQRHARPAVAGAQGSAAGSRGAPGVAAAGAVAGRGSGSAGAGSGSAGGPPARGAGAAAEAGGSPPQYLTASAGPWRTRPLPASAAHPPAASPQQHHQPPHRARTLSAAPLRPTGPGAPPHPPPAVAAGALPSGRSAAHSAGRARRPGPMRLLPGLRPASGRQPGSHEVHPPSPPPDVYRTLHMDSVRQTLARGASTPVHHTLKSKIMEDATRHKHQLAPHRAVTQGPGVDAAGGRSSGRAGGGGAAAAAAGGAPVPFFPPHALISNERAAVHELALRHRLGLPVTPDLVAARQLAIPQQARLVVREKAKPEPEAVINEPDEVGTFTSRYGFQVVPSPNDPTHNAKPPAAAAAERQRRMAADESLWRPTTARARDQPFTILKSKPDIFTGAFTFPPTAEAIAAGASATRVSLSGWADPSIGAAVAAGAAQRRAEAAGAGMPPLPGGYKLAAPEAHVRGVPDSPDGGFRRAVAARAVAAGEAAVRAGGGGSHTTSTVSAAGGAAGSQAGAGAATGGPVYGGPAGGSLLTAGFGVAAPSLAGTATFGAWQGASPPTPPGPAPSTAAASTARSPLSHGGGGTPQHHATHGSVGSAGGGGGQRKGGTARHGTSSWRARGGSPLRLVVRGEWGDPDLNRSVRDAIRYLSGGKVLHTLRDQVPGDQQHGPSHAPGSSTSPPLGGVWASCQQRSRGSSASPARAPRRSRSSSAGRSGHRGRSTGRAGAGGGGDAAGSPRRADRRWAPREGSPVTVWRYRDGKLTYTGSRPNFDASTTPQYELPGFHPQPLGQPPWTKADAERVAGAVSAGVRGNSELHWAASRGDAARVGELLRAADPVSRSHLANARNESGETPLHRAAACRPGSSLAAMQYLLGAGADPDARDAEGGTPLVRIVTSESWLPEGYDRMRLLLGAGASPALCDCEGETLLHKALIHGVCSGPGSLATKGGIAAGLNELLEALLPLAREPAGLRHQPQGVRDEMEARTGPTAPPSASLQALPELYGYVPPPPPPPPSSGGDGGSARRVQFAEAHPLAAAAGAESSGALVALVVAEAAKHPLGGPGSAGRGRARVMYSLDVDARDRAGRTPLHVACARPHTHGPGMEKCCVSALLQAGADPNAQDDAARRPLHWLLRDAAAATRLREANEINHTKLATARPKQSPGCLVWLAHELLQAGADPRVADASGTPPLHLALQARSKPLVRLLLRFGADPLARDGAGRTAAEVLRAQIGATRDRGETARLEAMEQLVLQYAGAAERRRTLEREGGGAAARAGRTQRRAAAGRGRMGLGGGGGPKTMRQLYQERFGDTTTEDEEELDAAPTQRDLVQAYLAAMRASRGEAPPQQQLPQPLPSQSSQRGTDSGRRAPPDLEQAVVRIQAAYWGHKARMELRKKGVAVEPPAARRPGGVAASRAGSTATSTAGGAARSGGGGGGGGAHRGSAPFVPDRQYGAEHEAAAVKIQAAHRGRMARRKLYEQRRAAIGAVRQAEEAVAAVAVAELASGGVSAGRERAGTAAGAHGARQESGPRPGGAAAVEAAGAGSAGPGAAGGPGGHRALQPAAAAPPAPPPRALAPDGRPYTARHDKAAARIQASWKGRKARKTYERVRQAAADTSNDLDLFLDEDELRALSAQPLLLGRSKSRGAGGGGRSGVQRQASTAAAGAGAGEAPGTGQGGGEGGGGGAVGAAGGVHEAAGGVLPAAAAEAGGGVAEQAGGSAAARYAGSDGGGSDRVPPSAGWSESSLADSLAGAGAPEAPPLSPPRLRGSGPVIPAPAHPAAAPGTAGPLLARAASVRAPRAVPQVSLTPDGQLVGDVGDLDLLDLSDDGSLPSGVLMEEEDEGGAGGGAGGGGPYAVVQHADDDDDVF